MTNEKIASSAKTVTYRCHSGFPFAGFPASVELDYSGLPQGARVVSIP